MKDAVSLSRHAGGGTHKPKKGGNNGGKAGCGEKTAWETRHVAVEMEIERDEERGSEMRESEMRSEGAREQGSEMRSEGARERDDETRAS